MAELDKIRTELMNSSAITVQRYFRGYKARKGYLKRKRAVITLQVRPPNDDQNCLKFTWLAVPDDGC